MRAKGPDGRFGLGGVQFPIRPEANVLVERYIQHINHFHHSVHVPSLWDVVRNVFDCLERQATIEPGPATLVLAVLASGARCSADSEIGKGIFVHPENGQQQAKIWLQDIEDIIDIAHRTTKVSIEGCQALIVASFVVADAEGLSLRFRSHINLAMLLARRLGLHRIDAADGIRPTDPVAAETGRCVWWFIVATDW